MLFALLAQKLCDALDDVDLDDLPTDVIAAQEELQAALDAYRTDLACEAAALLENVRLVETKKESAS
jgi:hypothetical protein